jgi:hypothetical protein
MLHIPLQIGPLSFTAIFVDCFVEWALSFWILNLASVPAV